MPNNYHVILHVHVTYCNFYMTTYCYMRRLLYALRSTISVNLLFYYHLLIKAVCMSLCFVRFTETISHDVFIPLEKIRNINTLYHLHLLCDLSFLLSCIACGYAACTLFFLYHFINSHSYHNLYISYYLLIFTSSHGYHLFWSYICLHDCMCTFTWIFCCSLDCMDDDEMHDELALLLAPCGRGVCDSALILRAGLCGCAGEDVSMLSVYMNVWCVI